MCFFEIKTFRHFHIRTGLSFIVSVTYCYVTSCPKLSGLEEQPNILLLMICESDIWAGLSGDSFSLFCKVLAETDTLGLEKSR